MIHQLLYRSRANIEVSPLILACIGDIAESRNARLGITGLLCHQDGMFTQLLEGPRDAVELVMDKIVADRRHCDIEILQRRDVAQREYGQWAMAIVCEDDDEAVDLTERCCAQAAGASMTTPADMPQISAVNPLCAD